MLCLSELIRAERLQVSHVRSHSVVLQWRPVLSGGLGFYELYYGPDPSHGTMGSVNKESDRKLIIPGDFSWTELNNLEPDTIYTARLIPETNIHNIKPLNVTFRTLPGENTCVLICPKTDVIYSDVSVCYLTQFHFL